MARPKKLIFSFCALFLGLWIAVSARYVDPDRWLRHRNAGLNVSQIAWDGLQQSPWTLDREAYILQGWLLRVSSSVDTALQLRIGQNSDGKLVLWDGQDRTFVLGQLESKPQDSAAVYRVALEPGDQAEFQLSRSVFPYYAGWKILSTAPLFQYFRYYTLRIRRTNGAVLQMEWKFSTYRRPDGEWTPDQFGSQGEGLVRMDLRMEK